VAHRTRDSTSWKMRKALLQKLLQTVAAACAELFASSKDGASEIGSAVTEGSAKRSRLDSVFTKPDNRENQLPKPSDRLMGRIGSSSQDGPCCATTRDGRQRGRLYSGQFCRGARHGRR
jgi:hypothetical protein